MLSVEEIAPHMIEVQFDIEDDTDRDQFRRKLKRQCAVMKSYSVYHVPFTASGFAEIKKFEQDNAEEVRRAEQRGRKVKLFRVVVVRPFYPNRTEARLVVSQYEDGFNREFSELGGLIKKINRALMDDDLFTVKKGKNKGKQVPFTADQIAGRINHANSILQDLEVALARRRERELKTFEKNPQDFEELELLLQKDRALLDKLTQSCKQRKLRETPA